MSFPFATLLTLAIFCTLSLQIIQVTYAAELYVAIGGAGTKSSGCLINAPCPNIAMALRQANSYDTIVINPGTYSGIGNEGLNTSSFNKTSDHVKIVGKGPSNSVTIKCILGYRFIASQNSYIFIGNVTIQNCSTSKRIVTLQNGGALLIFNSTFAMVHTILQSNKANNGGAIHITASNVSFEHVTCRYNTGETSGGMWVLCGVVWCGVGRD